MSRKDPADRKTVVAVSMAASLAVRLREASDATDAPVSQILSRLAEGFLDGTITLVGVNPPRPSV